MRPQDYAFFAGLAAVVGSMVLAARGHAMPAVLAAAAVGVVSMWSSHPLSRRCWTRADVGFSLDAWRGTRLLYLARFRATPMP